MLINMKFNNNINKYESFSNTVRYSNTRSSISSFGYIDKKLTQLIDELIFISCNYTNKTKKI